MKWWVVDNNLQRFQSVELVNLSEPLSPLITDKKGRSGSDGIDSEGMHLSSLSPHFNTFCPIGVALPTLAFLYLRQSPKSSNTSVDTTLSGLLIYVKAERIAIVKTWSRK